jgi:uncharacterized protein (TIGR02452 family)
MLVSFRDPYTGLVIDPLIEPRISSVKLEVDDKHNERSGNMSKANNIRIFQDTRNLIKTDATLRALTDAAKENTFLYKPNPAGVRKVRSNDTYAAHREVTKERAIECALRLAKETTGRIAVLNFASPKHAGGGVVKGASAQEESICRITNLYPCLQAMQNKRVFYDTRQRSPYTDQVLYSRDITVIKSDEYEPRLLTEDERIQIDIVTCAAPNQTGQKIPDDELYKIICRRIRRVLDACVENGATNIVLGAWGCGAFRNPPKVVANALMAGIYSHHYEDGFADNYTFAFDNIVFAVYTRKYEQENYDVFAEVIKYWFYP